MAKKLSKELSKRGIPDALRGAYANLIAGKPDEEGVSYIPNQEAANIISGEQLHPSGYQGTAFAIDPLEARYSGFDPEQLAFINELRTRRWAEDTGLPEGIIDENLRGHELYHANSLMGGKPVYNSGQQASTNVRTPIENSPASIETWLANYAPEQRPQERGAALAGDKRVREMLALRRAAR